MVDGLGGGERNKDGEHTGAPTRTTQQSHDELRDQGQLAYLSRFVAVVPDFLPKETADRLLRELLADARANWKPERVRRGRAGYGLQRTLFRTHARTPCTCIRQTNKQTARGRGTGG